MFVCKSKLMNRLSLYESTFKTVHWPVVQWLSFEFNNLKIKSITSVRMLTKKTFFNVQG